MESFTFLSPESVDEEQTVGEYTKKLAFFFQQLSRKGRFTTEVRKQVDVAIRDSLEQLSQSEAGISKERLISLADAMRQLEKAIGSIALKNEIFAIRA